MSEWCVMLDDRVIERFEMQEGDTITIGRGTDADVRIDNTGISRKQTTIQLHQGRHLLTDLKSLNGTVVNGRKTEGTVAVSDKDRIEIAKFRLVLVSPPEAKEPTTAAPLDFEPTVYLGAKSAVGQDGQKALRLRVVAGRGRPTRLPLKGKGLVRIGKGARTDISVSGLLVGSPQCYIEAREGVYVVVHQGRWRKTTVNGEPVDGELSLEPGDTIGIGGTRIKLE